jgi:hypothetical protein
MIDIDKLDTLPTREKFIVPRDGNECTERKNTPSGRISFWSHLLLVASSCVVRKLLSKGSVTTVVVVMDVSMNTGSLEHVRFTAENS